MAEEDNFDLDIYGDGGYNGQEGPELILDAPETNGHEGGEGQYGNNNNTQTANGQGEQHQIQSTAGQALRRRSSSSQCSKARNARLPRPKIDPQTQMRLLHSLFLNYSGGLLTTISAAGSMRLMLRMS